MLGIIHSVFLRPIGQEHNYSALIPGFSDRQFKSHFKKLGAGKMGQWLRALAVLTKDPGSFPSIHVGWFTSSYDGRLMESNALFCLQQALAHTYSQTLPYICVKLETRVFFLFFF